MMRRSPSLKDVAERAGVSFQTTSKVLRGGGTVAEATRRRILVAADELGYVANDIARSLVTERTRTIGIAVADLSDHIITRFVAGAELEARRRNHTAVVVSVDPGSAEGERSLRSLLERRVDGIVAAAPQLEDDERLGDLLRGRVPTVSIHVVAGGGVGLVGSDQTEIGRMATAHLLALGHPRVGMVTGTLARRAAVARARGYTAALAAAGLDVDEALVAEGDWQPDGGYRAAAEVLDRAPDVSALFVHNDLMAVGAIHAVSERGLRVPDDVAVVGCDDIPTAAHTIPPLSTVRLPFAQTGAAAVSLLLDNPPESIGAMPPVLLPATLVCRRSCGCGAAPPDHDTAGQPAGPSKGSPDE